LERPPLLELTPAREAGFAVPHRFVDFQEVLTGGGEQAFGLLVSIDPPDAGTLHTIGPLGVSTTTRWQF
jgi:hypothetical protein